MSQVIEDKLLLHTRMPAHNDKENRSAGKKPGALTLSTSFQDKSDGTSLDERLDNVACPSSPTKKTFKQEDTDIIQNFFEPLYIGPFTLDLAWDLAKDKFGAGNAPTPRFLAIIDRLLSQNIIREVKYLESVKTIEFATDDKQEHFCTPDTVWQRYYTHWAKQAAALNTKLRTKEVVNALLEYSCFQPHYQRLFSKILSLDSQSTADATLSHIGDHLGGHLSELCTALLRPTEAIKITCALMNICNAQVSTIPPPGPAKAPSSAARPSVTAVASRVDHGTLQRLNGLFAEACDTLCGAIVQVRQLPRWPRVGVVLSEALLQLGFSQHEQADRLGGSVEVDAALRENVKCLYEEVLTLCQNEPRGPVPSSALYIRKGRALTGMGCLLAGEEGSEEARRHFQFALECLHRAMEGQVHPLMVDTLLGLSALEKELGNTDLAQRHVQSACGIVQTLNDAVAGLACQPYAMSTAKCLNSTALLLDDADQFHEAVEGYLRAQALYSDLWGSECLAVADIAMNLGSLYTSLGSHIPALEAFKRAVRTYRRRFGPVGSDTISAIQSLEACQVAVEMDQAQHSVYTPGKDVEKDPETFSIEDITGSNSGIADVSEGGMGIGRGGESVDSRGDGEGIVGERDQPLRRGFPQNVEFLMVQAELMWANDYHAEARAAYEEALLKCREQERDEIAAIKARETLVRRTAMCARARKIVVLDDVSDGDTDTDDDGDGGLDYDSDDAAEPGSRYIVNGASLYIAEVLLCLGDLRDAVRGGSEVTGEDPEAFDENEKEKRAVVSLYEEALAIYRIVLGEEDVRVADTLCKLGSHFANETEYEHAGELFQEALVLYRLWWKTDTARDVLEAKQMLARCWQGQQLREDAIELATEVLNTYVTLHKDEVAHSDVANAWNSKGSILQEQEVYEEALKHYTQALDMYKVIYADEVEGSHPLIARAYNNMGSVYDDMGNFNDAKRMFEQALSILSELHRNGHPQIAITVCNLASLLSHEGMIEEARPLYELALSIYKKTYGENHQTVKDTLMLLEKMNNDGGGWGKSVCALM